MDMAEEHANLNIIGTQLFVEHPVEGVVEVEISEVDSSDPDFTIFGLTDAVGSTEFKTHRELTALLAQERQEKLEQCHAMLQALDTAVLCLRSSAHAPPAVIQQVLGPLILPECTVASLSSCLPGPRRHGATR